MSKLFDQIDKIKAHIHKVESNCYKLAKGLEGSVPDEMVLELVQRGRLHDASKFAPPEFYPLHLSDTNSYEFKQALKAHRHNNMHHPEYHFGIVLMKEIDIAEMVCDWVARGQEFGTGVREWIEESATKTYNFTMDDRIGLSITKYLNILLTPKFS